MSNLRKDLDLVEVVYEDGGQKATMAFLDREEGQVLNVIFNKRSYDTEKGEFVDDPEKAEQVEEWCQEYFDIDFEGLPNCVGVKKDVYTYDKFNSLWETKVTEKFKKEDVGRIFETEITRFEDDGVALRIYFEVDGKEHESKMTYAKYLELENKWYEDPVQKRKRYDQFKSKFGVPVEEGQEIVGKNIMVEVKIAFGKFPYAEIKKPNWA